MKFIDLLEGKKLYEDYLHEKVESPQSEKEVNALMKQLEKVKKVIKPTSKNEFSMKDYADFLQLQGKLETLFDKVDMS